ncbi:MAG: HEAT repeat domain-containing protein [Gemmatimonadota bacterium]
MGRRTMVAAALVALSIPAGAGAQSGMAEARAQLERALVEGRVETAEMNRELFRVRQELAAVAAEAGVRSRDYSRARLERALEEVGRSRSVRSGRWIEASRRAERVPEAWLTQDPADSLYRAAREALNQGRYERAASLFAQIREAHPRSGYSPDSYYFQALALQRAGGSARLRQALELLAEQRSRYSDHATADDARALEVRIEGALARAGDAESAARIQERAAADCESDDQELRSAALGALLQMDADRAVPILREVLRSRGECSAELRKRAVFLVAQKMTPETVDILLDLAHENPDPDPEVREAAVFWLSQVRSEEAVDALQAILAESEDETLQERAVFAISQHPSERAAEVLRSYAVRQDAPEELREQAIFWIGQRHDAESGAFLRDLYGRLQDRELKEKVIFGVGQSPGEEGRRWLIDLARNEQEPMELRKNALFWAGQSGQLAAVDLAGLYDSMSDREMREQVIFALANGGSREGVTELMEIAENETDSELRQRAIFWLGQSDDSRVPEFLLRIIQGGG